MKIQDMSESGPGWQPTQAEVVAWLNRYPLCTLSTVDPEGWPQGATVAFSETDDLEFMIGTDETSRKARNMDNDPRVALTITNPEARFTVQAEGVARKLGREAFAKYEDRHYEKLPESAPFRDIAGQAFYLISPTLVRFSDCNPHPWVVTEFNLGDRDKLNIKNEI